jgi:riboflavin kinase/FMN adenylyltransferase
MAIFLNTQNLPSFKNAVITIGTFDGVHLGHETILHEVVRHAKEMDGESIVITFEPHPRKLLFPDQPLKLLTPLDHKLELIQEAGIQHVVVAPFTHAFSMLSAEDYIEHFLVKYFKPATIVIGYDHHFGHDRRGNLTLLKQFETTYNYKVVEIPAQLIEQAAVSSTKIRKALNEGHVQEAAHMLGRNYSITGTVIRGAQLGRTIGYPTANIQLTEPDQLIPAIGIYAARATWKEQQLNGMMSVGHNPTVTDEKKIHIEINIFDFDQDIYNETLEISFISYLRNEEKFPSLEALKEQLHQDKLNTIVALSR